MNRLIQIVFGLIVLAVPVALLVGAVMLLAMTVSLVPVFLPLTLTLATGAFIVAWVRWRRKQRRGPPR